jgi:hypothetical protein
MVGRWQDRPPATAPTTTTTTPTRTKKTPAVEIEEAWLFPETKDTSTTASTERTSAS